jgi:hypothetical protein
MEYPGFIVEFPSRGMKWPHFINTYKVIQIEWNSLIVNVTVKLPLLGRQNVVSGKVCSIGS